MLTLEGWNDVLATQYHGSDIGYDDVLKDKTAGLRVSEAQPITASVYFVTFILLGTMIMLNLFTGVIISSMEEAQEERAEESREESLKKKGFLTLHDELAMLSQRLIEITQRIKAIELKEDRAELEPEEAAIS